MTGYIQKKVIITVAPDHITDRYYPTRVISDKLCLSKIGKLSRIRSHHNRASNINKKELSSKNSCYICEKVCKSTRGLNNTCSHKKISPNGNKICQLCTMVLNVSPV